MDIEAKKLSALREELQRDLEALERVEKLIATKNGSLLRTAPTAINLKLEDKLSFRDSVDLDAPVTSLRGAIEDAFNADPSVRWTNQRMLAHLRNIRFDLKAQKPIYSIGQAIQKLADSGKIKLVRKGLGSQPNIYKGKSPEPQEVSMAQEPAVGSTEQN